MAVMPAAEGGVAGREPLIGSLGLIGRGPELTALGEALARPPALVLVEGEAGIGKSRLVQEFLNSAPRQRKGTLVACCPPFDRPLTLAPVVDALRQAGADIAGLRLSALAGALRPLFPEWAGDLPLAPGPLEDASAARHRLFGALAELLDRLKVTVLVVEDAHWADEATVEFLLFVTSRRLQRVSLVVTYRPEDVPGRSLLRRLTSRLPAGTTCQRITLGPLDVAGTAGLVSSMLAGEHVSEEFAAFLHERTDGVPLYTEESVRLMRDRRDLAHRGGEWVRRALAELAVPPTVRDAVLERAERLDPAASAVLHAAAILADPVSEPVLVKVSGVSVNEAASGLAVALATRLLNEDERGLVSFRHVLASRAVYETIPGPERRRGHLRAAHVLEGQSPAPVAQLARHFREARDTERWCRYAEHAADLALAAGDDRTAATLLHDLITHPDMPAGAFVRLTSKLPLAALSRHAALSDIVHTLRSTLRRGVLSVNQRAEVSARLGRCLFNAGEYEGAVGQLERAVSGLSHQPVEAARAMVLLGWPDHTLWPVGVHRRWLDRAAAAIAEVPISVTCRVEFTAHRAGALLQMGEEVGWAVAAEIPEVADRPQEALEIARGCLNIGDAAIPWGRYDEARRRLTAALRLAESLNYPILRDGSLVTLAHVDWFTGAWTGLADHVALAELDDADPLFCLEAVLVVGLLEAVAGAKGCAEVKLQQVLEEATRRGILDLTLESAAALARMALADGDVQDALALTEDPFRVITAKRIWLWATDVAQVRVQALAAAGRFEEAASLISAFARGLRGRPSAPGMMA